MLNLYQDVFKCLSCHKVRYVVIGGVAAILHGVPRATFDLDILVEATENNVRKLLDAFLEAGLGTAALIEPQTLLANEITIFKDRLRIDVQTRTPGLEFQEAWRRRTIMTYNGGEFFVVCKEDLVRSKEAAGREIDLADIRLLDSSSPEG